MIGSIGGGGGLLVMCVTVKDGWRRSYPFSFCPVPHYAAGVGNADT